jgi:hypothetical protein
VIVPLNKSFGQVGVATALELDLPAVAVIGVPGQPLAIGVIVKVTVMGAFVVLVKLKDVPATKHSYPVTVVFISKSNQKWSKPHLQKGLSV